MSVASTKAFYAQVAAGLPAGLRPGRRRSGCGERRRHDRLLRPCASLPDAMERVLARRDDHRRRGGRLAPARRYWAVVGNGPNRIAAAEIRIKLSELCYKSIAC